ncbi:hypothetical protein [Gynuella sp.]|uniref:hypothetical protein n=1 Tax=Gynuella sp. TaxID=2969146 RepID=UPI003D128EBB
MADNLVLQRVRNRIIELLDWYSDSSEFETAISNLEMWEDWVGGNNIGSFVPPTFSRKEIVALRTVSEVWKRISLDTKQTDVDWIAFSSCCAKALTIFNERGLLSEIVAIT